MSLLNQSIIKHKMGLLNLAEELHNVSQVGSPRRYCSLPART
jgi:hypothetical protein